METGQIFPNPVGPAASDADNTVVLEINGVFAGYVPEPLTFNVTLSFNG